MHRKSSSRNEFSDIPIQRKASSRSRQSRQSSRGYDYGNIDPVEMKRRQLEKLRDQQNLRKFVMATSPAIDRKDSIANSQHDGDSKQKGFLNMLRGRSLSRSRSKQPYPDERGNDARHYEADDDQYRGKKMGHGKNVSPPPPRSSSKYDDAEIPSRTRQRSASRPRVRNEESDYKPTRSRSTSRSGSRIKDDDHEHHLSPKSRDRSLSRPRAQREQNTGTGTRIIIDLDDNDRSSSRPRTKTGGEHDDWNPPSKKHLPPKPSGPRRNVSEGSHERSSSVNRSRSRTGREGNEAQQEGRSSSRPRSLSRNRQEEYSSDRQSKGSSAQRSGSRSSREGYSAERNSKGSSEPRSPSRSSREAREAYSSSDGKKRSSSRNGDQHSRKYDRNESNQYNVHSRTQRSRNSKENSYNARSIQNKGASGTRAMLKHNGSEDSDDIFFVK